MNEVPQDVRAIARKMASKSIVTQALARYIEQIMEHIHETEIAPLLDQIAADAATIATTREGLVAAIRAAELAIFVIRKQGVMPNSSWQSGFEKDLAIAKEALNAAPPRAMHAAPASPSPEDGQNGWRDDMENAPKDGTPLLMFSPYERDLNCKGGIIWVSGGWHMEFGRWRGDVHMPTPTHWQPVPTSPASYGKIAHKGGDSNTTRQPLPAPPAASKEG